CDVVDDQTEVSMLAPRLDGVLEESDELVTEVDESHVARLAAQLQLREERAPELECLLEAADVERDMIDPQHTSHPVGQRRLGVAIPWKAATERAWRSALRRLGAQFLERAEVSRELAGVQAWGE